MISNHFSMPSEVEEMLKNPQLTKQTPTTHLQNLEEFSDEGWEADQEEEQYRIRLTSAWVFEVNRYANLVDYLGRPLRELLEALSVVRIRERMDRKFQASLQGIKLGE